MHVVLLNQLFQPSLEMCSATVETLLPPSSSALEKALEQLGLKISALPVPFVQLHRIDNCSERFLPWLAWEHRVEYWNPNWNEADKRAAIVAATDFNAQRGTRASLQSLLNTVITDYQLIPWHQFNPKGTPYTFVVQVPQQVILTIEQLVQIYTAVDATKSQRDLYAVNASVKTDGNMIVAGAAYFGETVTLSTS